MVPDSSAVNDGIVELQDVIDLAFARPMGALQELYVSGLAMSSNALLRQSNQIAMIRTPAPSLQRLTMHWCNRCPMASLTMAIAQDKLPRLSWLEAIYNEADYNVEDITALYTLLEKRSIAVSPKMRDYYSYIDQQYKKKVLEEQKTTKQHKDDLSRIIEETAAAIPDVGSSRSNGSRRSSSRHGRSRRHSSSKHKHRHTSSSKRSSSRDKGKRSGSSSTRNSPYYRSKDVESSSSEEEYSRSESSDGSTSESDDSRSKRSRKGKSKSRSRSQRRRSH